MFHKDLKASSRIFYHSATCGKVQIHHVPCILEHLERSRDSLECFTIQSIIEALVGPCHELFSLGNGIAVVLKCVGPNLRPLPDADSTFFGHKHIKLKLIPLHLIGKLWRGVKAFSLELFWQSTKSVC
uniref:Uncharacterized protein n=1 Tax=Daucus carota subsp. sativus TaxID=79200 RepID=A0A164UZS1_DAUCS